MLGITCISRLALHRTCHLVRPCIVPKVCTLNPVEFPSLGVRSKHTYTGFRNRSPMYYTAAVAVLVLGLSYAAVPVYRLFCQATGYAGTTKTHSGNSLENVKKRPERTLKIMFTADTNSEMNWNFKPQQRELTVIPGETALAFYTAENPTDEPIIGISTYNVLPFEAGQYFNKIQCFCFEEQMLNPHEEVDMPVFFYIDPAFADDPELELVNTVILSYTFFKAKEGIKLPVPSFLKKNH